MFFNNKSPSIKIVKDIDVTNKSWCNCGVLIEVVNGKGKLVVQSISKKDDYYGSVSFNTLSLNDTPIIQSNSPGCPTCASMLATGYGLQDILCDEIKSIINSINSNYKNIYQSIETITPILGLLENGLYVIADVLCYPTDGNNNFFWNVPNKMTTNPATAVILTEDYDCVNGIPVYTYPSQGTECFNEERTSYYKNKYKDSTDSFPRAIAYNYCEFINVLIDGHHKATACALLGKPFPCLTIIPATAMSYCHYPTKINEVHFGDIKISSTMLSYSHINLLKNKFQYKNNKRKKMIYSEYNLIKNNWPAQYIQLSSKFPSVIDLAEDITLGIENICEEMINNCLINTDENKAKILSTVIRRLSRDSNDVLIKSISLKCGLKSQFPTLQRVAFTALSQIKNDEDIENFFVNYLIEDLDSHSILRKIANSYWD